MLLDQNGVPCPKLKELNFSLSLMGACTNPWFEIVLWNYWHALCYKVENSDRLCHVSIVESESKQPKLKSLTSQT